MFDLNSADGGGGGERGLSTMVTLNGLIGDDAADAELPANEGGDKGVFGISTMGLGVRWGTKSD